MGTRRRNKPFAFPRDILYSRGYHARKYDRKGRLQYEDAPHAKDLAKQLFFRTVRAERLSVVGDEKGDRTVQKLLDEIHRQERGKADIFAERANIHTDGHIRGRPGFAHGSGEAKISSI